MRLHYHRFASHVHVVSHHELHKEVMDKIAQNNANYEIQIDIRKKLKTFNVGDYVMVWILKNT